jgi:hypothetical protein
MARMERRIQALLATAAPGQLRNPATRPVWFNERNLRTAARFAARFADGGSSLLIVWLVVTLVTLPEHSRTWLRPLAAANVLIALLIARKLVANIYAALSYRRERR